MSSSFSRVVSLSLCFSISLSAYAQTPATEQENRPNDDEVVRVTTNLVQVDAVVTDKKGKHVSDLRAEDFQILEDGRPQQITNLSYIRTDQAASTQGGPRLKLEEAVHLSKVLYDQSRFTAP